MRALVQRVKWAKVVVDGQTVGEIGPGILTLLGIGRGDSREKLEWTVRKVLNLRIFEDSDGKMNLSVLDLAAGGAPEAYGHLLVSQFTLYGDTTKGTRPGFTEAAPPEVARALYDEALKINSEIGGAVGVKTAGGVFRAHMEVTLLNDGPVTLWVEK